MEYQDIMRAIRQLRLDEGELRELNQEVCSRLKQIRNVESGRMRHLLSAGDKVSYSGRRGHTEGVIVRVKRKKALVRVGVVTWDVPLSMLTAV